MRQTYLLHGGLFSFWLDDVERNASTAASTRLQHTYEKCFDAQIFRESQQHTDQLLVEEERKQSLRKQQACSSMRSNERRNKNVEETQL